MRPCLAQSADDTPPVYDSPMDETTRATHYVLVIHGTFADRPKRGQTSWYHLTEDKTNFCNQLAERLRGTPLEGAVWRSYAPPFWHWWPGENDHMARKRAGRRLADEIAALAQRDPTARVHLVAHSHGGNVVLSALDRCLRNTDARSHLGRLVFLGTPFLRRRWNKRRSLGELVAQSLVAAVFVAIVLGSALTIGAALVSPFSEWTLGGAFRIWSWNPWVLAALGAVALCGGFSVAAGSTYRKDSNVYLDELFFERQELPELEMLTIHSGELDEALTLLSATPALDAVSDPVIDEVSRGLIWAKKRDPEADGQRTGERQPLWGSLLFVFSAFWFMILQLFYLGFPFVERGLLRRVKTRLKGLVLRVFEAEALGLTAHELEDCRIEVSERLELALGGPKIFSEDVSRHLAGRRDGDTVSAPGSTPESEAESELTSRDRRFEYLWDSQALAEAIAGSPMWRHRIAPRLDHLGATYGERDSDFIERLQRRVLTIERRWQEISTGVSLDHSAYYEVPTVIDRIAEFLIGTPTERDSP